MKNTFLNKLSTINLDEFISNFMDYKDSIGNGVGAGKAFERFMCNQINDKMNGVYAIHLNLSNSSFIWDIIVTDNKNALSLKDTLINVIKNESDIEGKITETLGNNWLGISLKTYKDDACQITTDYSYRTYLEEKALESELPTDLMVEFNSLLNKHDQSRYLIMALNTYDNVSAHNSEIEKLENKLKSLKNKKLVQETTDKIKFLKIQTVVNVYTFRLLEFSKMFDKISYKKNSKLSQYDLSIGGENLFKVLYGKNQANAFQRGIWTHNKKSIEYFQMVKTGNYKPGVYNKIIESTIGMTQDEIKKVLDFINNGCK